MRRWLISLLLFGCDVSGSVGQGYNPATQQLISQPLHFGAHTNIDILFVVDNSPGMIPKQADLRAALPGLASQLPMDRHYHFGVITTDLGAGPKGFANCTAPGDNALLVGRGGFVNAGCLGPVGGRYLDFNPLGQSNLPPDQGLVDTLACMIDVGDVGCGFEQPLEAARRALSGQPINAGFLREDSLLVILFLTDEDDCSAPIDSPLFAPPISDSFRCTQAGVVCGDPPRPPSSDPDFPTLDCRVVSGGPLYDLSRYRDFFFSTSGVKRNPNDVRIVLLSAPAGPISVSVGATGQDQLDPACGSPGKAGFPAVRLHALFDTLPSVTEASICTSGSYDYALGSVASHFTVPATCLPLPIADPDHPDCTVTLGDQVIPPCTVGAGMCWELVERPDCVPVHSPRTRHDEQLALNVRGVPLPTSAACTVIAPLR